MTRSIGFRRRHKVAIILATRLVHSSNRSVQDLNSQLFPAKDVDMDEEMAPAELRLHIGAHKTATTHLQDILAANRTYFIGNNILYLPRLFVRQMRLIKTFNN